MGQIRYSPGTDFSKLENDFETALTEAIKPLLEAGLTAKEICEHWFPETIMRLPWGEDETPDGD